MTDGIRRCEWAASGLCRPYHDTEWGVPVHDDRLLFEHLVLDTMQAGLSWELMLKKREGFRRAFDGFDPAAIARYDDRRVERLLADPGIIRNRQKIRAAISNAAAFLAVQEEHGSFDAYLWGFVGGRTIVNTWKTEAEIPTTSPEAEALSRDLKGRGFKFVGPTTVYAWMQAVGLVNDHTVDCFRYREVMRLPGPERSSR
jgi:DNA-3-methyladenine glycosylase I